jgi:integrase
MWIELKGRQHRVYWRTNLPTPSPAKAYEAFASAEDARSFIGFARWVGLPAARQYLADPSPEAMAALVNTPTLSAATADQPTADGTSAVIAPPLPGTGSDPAVTGVLFDQLWSKFMNTQRHLEEGTVELYTSYGELHLLPFFTGVDLGLIQRTRPLRAAQVHPEAVYVDDGWVAGMLTKEKLNNVRKPIAGKPLTLKFIQNVLVVLGQVFELALEERPALLEINPARHITLPKQDRREMHFLEDERAYLSLRDATEEHFWPLLDFLVGTGARYGEAAGLLIKHLHLDAERPHVDIRLALKWRGKKWKLGRPKTRSSIRRITLPSRLVEALRPLVEGKDDEEHVFTMVEGGPLHHGNFLNRYFRPAAQLAVGVPNGMRIHDLRHTHAAWLLSDGEQPMFVALRLGHSSAATTTNIYGHITIRADGALLDKLDRRLPDVLARDERGAVRLQSTKAELALPEFDIDDLDDLAA